MRRANRINADWWKDRLLEAPGMAIAGIFIAVSAMMSITCGYRFGEPSGNALVFAAVALGVEAFADLSIPLFWRRVGFIGRALLIAFFAVCLAYKLEAAKRFAAENFGMRDAAMAKAAEGYDIALQRVEALRKTIADNADARLEKLIQTEIDAALRDPKTDGCTGKTNGPVTAAVCPKVDTLRAELARAKARDQAQADLTPALKTWREAAPVDGKAVQESAGPLQLALALAGITVAGWSALMATLVMALVEGGAIIVPILVEKASRARSGEVRRPAPAGDVWADAPMKKPPQPGPAAGEAQASQVSPEVSSTLSPRARRDRDELATFLGDRSERAAGEKVQSSKLYAVYFQWKTEQGGAPMTVQQFGTVLGKHLALSKSKIAGKNWYLDLRLRHPAQGRKAGKHLQAVAA